MIPCRALQLPPSRLHSVHRTFMSGQASYGLHVFTRTTKMIRRSQLVTLLGVCMFIGFTLTILGRSGARLPHSNPSTSAAQSDSEKPHPPSTSESHPIHQLVSKAEKEQAGLLQSQSKDLQDAVREYKKRYRIPPPPNFDKWYEFAKSKDVQFVDEYDTIYHALLPFWGVKPAVIRARAKEALGFDNALMGLLIRDGKVVSAAGGSEWQQKSTTGMVQDFVQHLPDMDLPFNVHDEPRVIVDHTDLERLVEFAKDKAMPPAFTNPSPKNIFSPRPADMDDGKTFHEVKTTRFNRFAHQPTWTNSRISCSHTTPARSLEEDPVDEHSTYAFSDLGLIYNKTAFSDICLSPSLRKTFGFFDRPNAFNIVHDLFPVFSQSKISSYQDILYPSPWYWSEKVAYRDGDDYGWDKKQPKMYWRGSTTGGFSRDGGWRRQHRQRLVEKINDIDKAKILSNESSTPEHQQWKTKEVSRTDYKHLFDVKFSHVGQCDPGDCDAQKEYFEIVAPAEQHAAWAYKYLLDIDGNAFSGRFYAFLQSKSLIYKMAIFREWHEEWLRPWTHYIPLSMKGDEYLESVRYFEEDPTGQVQAEKIANDGRQWSQKVLRNEDLEVWLFRLLLEYVSTRTKPAFPRLTL